MGMLINLMNMPFLGNLLNREVNKHTGSTALLGVAFLVQIGWLPASIIDKIDGLPTNQITAIIVGIVAVKLLMQFHVAALFKPKLVKLQDKLDCLKVEQQIAELKGGKNENK